MSKGRAADLSLHPRCCTSTIPFGSARHQQRGLGSTSLQCEARYRGSQQSLCLCLAMHRAEQRLQQSEDRKTHHRDQLVWSVGGVHFGLGCNFPARPSCQPYSRIPVQPYSVSGAIKRSVPLVNNCLSPVLNTGHAVCHGPSVPTRPCALRSGGGASPTSTNFRSWQRGFPKTQGLRRGLEPAMHGRQLHLARSG